MPVPRGPTGVRDRGRNAENPGSQAGERCTGGRSDRELRGPGCTEGRRRHRAAATRPSLASSRTARRPQTVRRDACAGGRGSQIQDTGKSQTPNPKFQTPSQTPKPSGTQTWDSGFPRVFNRWAREHTSRVGRTSTEVEPRTARCAIAPAAHGHKRASGAETFLIAAVFARCLLA